MTTAMLARGVGGSTRRRSPSASPTSARAAAAVPATTARACRCARCSPRRASATPRSTCWRGSHHKPTFPAALLERERERTIQGLRESLVRPDAIAQRTFSALDLSVASVRRRAHARVDRRNPPRRPDSLLARPFGARRGRSIIGDVSRAEAEDIAARLTDALPDAPPEAPLPAVTLPARQTLRIAHPATQAHIAIGLPAIRRGDADSSRSWSATTCSAAAASSRA